MHLKYSRATPGVGISTPLGGDHKRGYMRSLDLLPAEMREPPLRLWSSGVAPTWIFCISSRSLIRSALSGGAIDTDFSPVLIDTAQKVAPTFLSAEDQTASFKYKAKTGLRRYLSEARDNYIAPAQARLAAFSRS